MAKKFEDNLDAIKSVQAACGNAEFPITIKVEDGKLVSFEYETSWTVEGKKYTLTKDEVDAIEKWRKSALATSKAK